MTLFGLLGYVLAIGAAYWAGRRDGIDAMKDVTRTVVEDSARIVAENQRTMQYVTAECQRIIRDLDRSTNDSLDKQAATLTVQRGGRA